ncbi:HpcH/HpaI aldolase/citrate lyase family protein [Natrarchaeobaculum sulfurireducens]|uniref:Beta-methylmalyl-CoA lyase, Citrate lyase beta subunit family n=1 Tax=Natrarchaeobaculum sulfurireducens TaxID=2044521 RepID=A0A346PH60_9EURY|nr:CoA ester lyase [Natrarchaeobaculum sulfurireducens]AXR78855.1 Beta-methylmalyl-CoA lyase, Citrate lyase beta subunit family [Natrarchaeobaculum sulfurireducens]
MVRRSVLFTPGDRPEMLRKAADSGADVIVFDLEDAVSPDRKGEARTTVREVLSDSAFDPDCEVCVRLNASSEAFGDDLAVLLEDSTSLRLDSVMLPKVESAADIDELEAELEAHDEPRPVLALLESAAGILAAPDVAAAEATDALVFGAEDLSADLGATRTPEGTEVLYARQRAVVAAAAHDCVAIDTLVTDFGNDERLREDAAVSVQLGYDGKLAIHPAQVAPINEAFTPSIEEREWAEAVLEAKREADKAGRGVFEVDGEMIDAPLIAQAERILERTRAANHRK